ncbi:hypothetical protein TanjilG_02203 [Lupinus angustifolius]|uniref:Phytocyanin domain-containing protein n=1 Tax=Lupinus angustifolius TaxID=3871 RepID=A0A1J7HH81_LUPAN|nr:PREDICTED: cucumber peeling cupredoxin-like [Lupinus angustifolius]OIW11996.1 hypothetical protein TanjilG_02203 [Lupinus angustifolius]
MNKMSFIGGVMTILMVLQCTEAVTVHVVGDGLGWTVPEDISAYQTWASINNFALGDILSFNFETNRHDVAEVPKGSYESCTSNNTIGTIITTGPTNITLNRSGEHFYICTIGQHCINGQKLAINVSATPSTGALPPSTGALPPSTTTTPPPPFSAASGSALASVVLLLFSLFLGVAF